MVILRLIFEVGILFSSTKFFENCLMIETKFFFHLLYIPHHNKTIIANNTFIILLQVSKAKKRNLFLKKLIFL